MNGFVEMALHVAQMPQATIDELDRALPGFAGPADDLKEAEPLVREAAPHIEALQPIVIKAWPILRRAWPNIVALTPTLEDLISFARSKQQT